MKKRYLLFLVLFAFSYLQAKSQLKLYPVKSGIVKYEISGDTKGTKTMWFDNYGRKKRIETKTKTTTKMFGISNTTEKNELAIWDDNYVYSIDLNKNEGSKFEYTYNNPEIDKMSEEEKREFEEETLRSLGGKKLGKEKFLGRSCEVIEIMGAKSWIYKGINLKTETNVMGQEVIEKAVDFKENIKVSKNKFIPPSNITYYSQENYMPETATEEASNRGNSGSAAAALGKMFSQSNSTDKEQSKNSQRPTFLNAIKRMEKEETAKAKMSREKYSEIKLPFKKFKKEVSSISIENYKMLKVDESVSNGRKEYRAAFSGAGEKPLYVNAFNFDKEKVKSAEASVNEFNYKGNKAYFTAKENISIMSVVIKKYNTIINVMILKETQKDLLLKIMDQMNF